MSRIPALRIAHLEANGSVPAGSSDSVDGWPASVQSVEATIADSRIAARFVGGSTASKGQVLVIRLFGNFETLTTGPPGSHSPTGNVLTAVVNQYTGMTTDADQAQPRHLPSATVL